MSQDFVQISTTRPGSECCSAIWQGERRDRSEGSSARIFIVDDHVMMAQAVQLSLSTEGLTCEIAALGDGPDVRAQIARFAPQLVLLDLNLGQLDSLELIPAIQSTGARIIIVSASSHEPRLPAALTLGATGWVVKTQPFEQLLVAVKHVLRGIPLLPTDRQDELAAIGRQRLAMERDMRSRAARLTDREWQVLEALSEGHTVHEIAEKLFVSVATVRSHVQAILTKLGVGTQLAAVALAREFLTLV